MSTRTRAVRSGIAAVAASAAATAAIAAPAVATSGSNELNLNGGDKLQSNAWHCSTYVKHCSWQTSAKLLGNHPNNARWIAVNTEVKGHGVSPKITVGDTNNVEITFKSKKLVKTRWVNTKNWISWSGGKVSPSFTTAWVSVRSSASAYHRIFGRPKGVVAYAGAF